MQAKRLPIGFISGILYKDLQLDWKAALTRAVDLGFTEIELGNHLGYSDVPFASFCKSIGLRIVGGGIKLEQDKDVTIKRMEQLKGWGAEYAVAFWPWLAGGLVKVSLDECKRSAELLNRMGEIAKEIEIDFSWHNHDIEFRSMEDGLPFDYLMNHTERSNVFCEMDTYWVTKSGADPTEVLQRYRGRYRSLHVKDMANDEEKSITCVGEGILDFTPIITEAVSQGVRHFIVERERVEDGVKCLEVSSRHLRNLSI